MYYQKTSNVRMNEQSVDAAGEDEPKLQLLLEKHEEIQRNKGLIGQIEFDPELVGDEPSDTGKRFTITGLQVIYSSPEEDTVRSREAPRKFVSLEPLQRECRKRLDDLVKRAKSHFPATHDTRELIVRFIEQSRAAVDLREIDRKIKVLEKQNVEMLTAPVDKPKNTIQKQREVRRLLKEIQDAEKRIQRLKEMNANKASDGQKTIFNFDDDVAEMKVEFQVQITKEKVLLEALLEELASLEDQVKTVEKRIALMKQKKSQYVALFTENPGAPPKTEEQVENTEDRTEEEEEEAELQNEEEIADYDEEEQQKEVLAVGSITPVPETQDEEEV